MTGGCESGKREEDGKWARGGTGVKIESAYLPRGKANPNSLL